MQKIWEQDKTKLNKVEIAKLQEDGLDVIHDLERYAVSGVDAIAESDFDRLKWYGLYLQRPKKDGYFMQRVKVPGGMLRSTQARVLAQIARDFGHELLDITTRQAIQFHWIRIKDVPEIIKRLQDAGLSTVEAAGDCPRNIVASPLSGIDSGELIETGKLVQEIDKYFENNRDFSNLPRKFKIAVCGNAYNSVNAEIHDISFLPAVKQMGEGSCRGFHVYVGGGLSTRPRLAQKLDLFIRQEEVLKVVEAAAVIFRDYGYREKRSHARLKFLMEDWGIERFTQELLAICGPLASSGKDLTTGWNGGYFYGVHKQKQQGLNYVGLCVPAGRLYAQELQELARLAEEYGEGLIRTCNTQNLILPHVPDEAVERLLQEKVLRRLTPFPKMASAHTVTCTGKEFCPLAITETKKSVLDMINYLDNHVAMDVPVKIHVSGCANSCGEPQIADIGLQGTMTLVDKNLVEGFEIWLGGRLGPGAAFGTKLNGRIPAVKVAKVMEAILIYYRTEHREGELFHQFYERVGRENFQGILDELLS